ncbi:MAG TPA: WecB/TagA/CpsF family glycosyltransferase [Acidobacteriaceae bacterium]|jgi:N-acetylglucosaminyldiphosphoundecaprenol N-acetyl-beta-D-mannosaminyltransferase|nr:WecB/TagA/CpsF family glycosyltransferase [Acidobacteriaceae bacterium]
MIESEVCVAEEKAEATYTLLPRPPRFLLGRSPVDRISMEYAALLVTEVLLHRGELPPLTIVGPNAHLVNLAEHDDRFAEAMQAADLAVPDGVSVVMASRLLGVPIPERVPGGDLMERMCAESAHYGFRVFFLGGLPGAALMAAHNLKLRYPGLTICGTSCPPLGFEKNPVELAHILDEVNTAAPDLLCVAFGAPRQEIWMQENRGKLRVGAILPVGAALDTQAGLRRRAPKWTQMLGMEWFFRLAMEPTRLWRRYLIGNTKFIGLVLRQWAQERIGAVQRMSKRAAANRTAGNRASENPAEAPGHGD